MFRTVAALAAAAAIATLYAGPAQARGVNGYRVLEPLAPMGQHDDIYDAAVGSDGALWLTATRRYGGSLVRIDGANRISSYDVMQGISTPGRFLNGAIERGDSGRLWLRGGTWADGYRTGDYLLEVGTGGALRRTIWLPERRWALYPSPLLTGPGGELWTAYEGPKADPFAPVIRSPGFVRFEPRTGAIAELPVPELPEVFSWGTPLIMGSAGVFWGGDPTPNDDEDRGTRIWRISPAAARAIHVTTVRGSVSTMARDSTGRIWISAVRQVEGGFGNVVGTLWRLDPASGKLTRVRGVGGTVTELAAGRNGTMWALVMECVPADRCLGGVNRREPRVRTTLLRLPRTGRATRFVLPRSAGSADSLQIGPRRRVWLLLEGGRSYVKRVASFTIPRG
jgi:hypothetical protein